MALVSTFTLAETLKDAGVSIEEWCTMAVEKITLLLQPQYVPEQTSSDGLESQTSSEFPHEIVSHYFQTLSVSIKGIGNDNICKIGNQIVCDICVPYLRILSIDNRLKPASKLSVAAALNALANLLHALLLQEGSSSLRAKIINDVFISVIDQLCSQKSFESKFHEGLQVEPTEVGTEAKCIFDPQLIISLLHSVFEATGVESIEQMDAEIEPAIAALFGRLLILLQHCDLSSCFLLASSLLPLFVTKTHMERVLELWDLVTSIRRGKTTVDCSESDLTLIILCCFHDVFVCHNESSPFASPFSPEVLSSAPILDLRMNSTFWSIVQEGLVSSDPLARKRCMYLLHCVLMSVQDRKLESSSGQSVRSDKWVFWWGEVCAGELQKVWGDLILILETMEEKQIHIIMPVRSRLRSIMAATSKCIDGCYLLHISWLMVALSRVFVHHEAKSIIRWGVQETLNMPLEGSPLLEEEHWQFIFGPILTVLNETLVYGRVQNAPRYACPPVAQSLNLFLARFVTELPKEQKGLFVTQFISAVKSLRFADIPLVFVSRALSQLPMMPLVGPETLAVIRSVVLTCIMTHKPSLRAAIQCFLLTAVCRLTDLVKVSCKDVVLTLGSFRGSECLIFNSHAWMQACDWVIALHHQKWASSGGNESLTVPSLFEYLKTAIQGCLSGKAEQPLSALHLARFFLLAVDAECRSSSMLLSSKERSLEESLALLLTPLMDVIAGARTHVYMDPSRVHGALEIVLGVLAQFLGGKALENTWKGDEHLVGGFLYKCLLPWLPDTVTYIQDELLHGSKDADVPDLEHVTFCVNALDHLYQFMILFGYSFHSTRDFGPAYIANKATKTLLDACSGKDSTFLTPSFLGAVTSLCWLCSLPSSVEDPTLDGSLSAMVRCFSKLPANLKITKQKQLHNDCSTHQHTSSTSAGGGEPKLIDWGPLMSHCFLSYWKCILCTLKYLYGNDPQSLSGDSPIGAVVGGAVCPSSIDGAIPVGTTDVEALARSCLNNLDMAGQEIAVLIEWLSLLVPKLLPHGAAFLLSCIDTVWPLLLECREKHTPFWRALKAFLRLAFHPLLLFSLDSALVDMQQKYASEFFELGEARTGVYNLLVTHVCSMWQERFRDSGPEAVFQSLETHRELIMQACLFGPVHKKNLRPVEDVEMFIESLGGECSSNSLNLSRRLEDDNSVRVGILTFLIWAATMCAEQDVNNTEGVVACLQGFLHTYSKCILEKVADISSEKPKYYINTFTHRIKMRLLQTLLLLLKWTSKATDHLVAKHLLQQLQCDNQLSVRYLMEWAVVLTLGRQPELLDALFYPYLHHGQEKRLSRMCSIFTIALHLGRNMQTDEEKTAYYLRTFPAVYQWISSYHFVVRLYSQQTVISMWEDCSRCNLTEVLDHFRILESTIDFMRQISDAGKLGHKLRSNIFFSKFRTKSDLNIESIFYVLPRLSHVIEEEWIPVEAFTSASPVWRVENPPVNLHCDNVELLQALQGADPCDESGSDTRSIAYHLKSDYALNPDAASSGDVQKKITPWSNAAGVLDELFPEQPPLTVLESTGRRSSHPGGLVLVASLVSKIPNLGGLCRTCEIFGVSELALSNLKLLEENQFQSLSVTAEKWIKLTEVKLAALKDYLLSMRGQGYSIVGVEQTAQSQCITKYQFQQRTVLVLGNEREGIPVEVIHLLDDCVEIPQFGVIRSLNVHVSGALVIWEYAKQHTVTNTNTRS